MAFWGIQVKPGKPVTLSFEKSRPRLRISQATLGIGDSTNKILLQCNVGNKSPVLVCTLLPGKTESCGLELEFSEADGVVVFSVIGPRALFLTGYFLQSPTTHSLPHSDSESYGINIENSFTNECEDEDEDDELEDSFIDDREIKVSPPSPLISSDVEEKWKHRCCLKKKKKYQAVDSDSDSDDCISLSVLKNKADDKKHMRKTGQGNVQEPQVYVVPDTDSDEDKYLFSGIKKFMSGTKRCQGLQK